MKSFEMGKGITKTCNRQDYNNPDNGINVTYTLEYVTNETGITWEEMGSKKWYEQVKKQVFNDLNSVLIAFHRISHWDRTVDCKLFQSITNNEEIFVEDCIVDPLMCSSTIEMRERDRLSETVKYQEQEITIMREFLKKYNAEKTYADYREMALIDIERA